MNKINKIIKKDYPKYLTGLSDLPPEIYYLGKFPKNINKSIAIIGSRRMSEYGRDVLENIVPELVQRDIRIVSGLAPGVDTYSHELAIKNGGEVIGVLGYGFNFFKYEKLYFEYKGYTKKQLVNNLTLISPFKKSQTPKKYTFLYRNSLISALAPNLLIVEATLKSGVNSTVEYALIQNKQVFAVPGTIFNKLSAGTNNLIKQGAQVFTSLEDILDLY